VLAPLPAFHIWDCTADREVIDHKYMKTMSIHILEIFLTKYNVPCSILACVAYVKKIKKGSNTDGNLARPPVARPTEEWDC
jgi:hypothetical protein